MSKKGEKPVKDFTMYGKWSNVVVYKYRGHHYEVEYSNGALNYMCSPAWVQHRDGQAAIDEALDHPKKKQVSKGRPVDEAVDLFLSWCDGEVGDDAWDELKGG